MKNFDEIREELGSAAVTASSSQATISSEDSDKLVTQVMADVPGRLTENEATAAISLVCQKGGTAKRAQGNIHAVINDKKVDLESIRKCGNKAGCKYTLRQWARSNADLIHKISEWYGVEGDLAKKIGRLHPGLSVSEKIWLSNFQMDNPNCPEELRAYLMEHYKSKFPGSV